MNVVVLDPELLASLHTQYGADLFVFLTQVEIKTTTKDCGDIQFRMYERDIKLHYAVFDKDGKQVMGDVTTVHFPSNSNEIHDIIEHNFPTIGEQITYAISIR
jgi:hypothetical protein